MSAAKINANVLNMAASFRILPNNRTPSMHILEFGKSFSRRFFDHCHAHRSQCLNLKHHVLYVASRIPFMSVEAGEDQLREYKKLQDACLRVKIRPTTGDSYIKIGLNVVLNHEPTDVRSKRRCLRQRYFEHSRTYIGCFLCQWDTFLAGGSCFRHSLERQRVLSSRACGPRTRIFDTCAPGQRLSWLLNFVSGSPFARALSLRKMKKFLLEIFRFVNYFSLYYKINAFYRNPFFFFY